MRTAAVAAIATTKLRSNGKRGVTGPPPPTPPAARDAGRRKDTWGVLTVPIATQTSWGGAPNLQSRATTWQT